MDTFTVNDQINWHYTHPASYGYSLNIPGKVTILTGKRVQIEIHNKKSGDTVRRWVQPTNLYQTGYAYCDYCGILANRLDMTKGNNYHRVCKSCRDKGV